MEITPKKEKKHAKFRISFVLLFIFASFAICFNFYMKEDFEITEPAVKPVQTETSGTAAEEEEEEVPAQTAKAVNPVRKSDKLDKVYFEKAAFIGGERLSGLADNNIIPKENIYIDREFSVQSAGVDEKGNELDYDALYAFLSKKKYAAVYFMAGFCDLGKPEETLFDGLGKITAKLRSENKKVKIYYVSLLPVTAAQEEGDITNINIDLYNTALLRYANIKNVYFLDMNTVFVGNDGKLPETMTENGGMTLKKGTYTEIGDYLLSHIGD